jgi:GNAT superfamily N-acetyltransferase
MQIVLDPEIKAGDDAAIIAGLVAYNDAQTGLNQPDGRISILLKNDAGTTEGGLVARYYYGWLFIELLFVPEHLRGQDYGTKLMAQAEQFARDKKFDGLWVDTFAFQARGFYEKLGFTLFGEIKDYPPGHGRYFLQKRLSASSTETGRSVASPS